MRLEEKLPRLPDGTLLGTWLSELRQKAGYSLQTLARKAGVDDGNLSRVENNRIHPTIQTVVSICIALGLSLDELVKKLSSNDIEMNMSGNFHSQTDLPIDVVEVRDVFNWLYLWLGDTQKGGEAISSLITNAHTLRVMSQEFAFPYTQPKAVNILDALVWSPVYQFSINYPPFNNQHAFVKQLASMSAMGGYLVKEDIDVAVEGSSHTIDLPGKIKFTDVMRISMQRYGNWDLVNLYWHLTLSTNAFNDELERLGVWLDSRRIKGYQWEPSTPWIDYVTHLARNFLFLCRWQQFLSPDSGAWLVELRQKLDNESNLHV